MVVFFNFYIQIHFVCFIIFLGIDIKAEREDGLSNEEAAAQFTKEKVLQREV